MSRAGKVLKLFEKLEPGQKLRIDADDIPDLDRPGNYVPAGNYEVKKYGPRITELYMLDKDKRQSVYKVETKDLE